MKPWITLPKAPTKLPELRTILEIGDGRRVSRTERIEDHPEITPLFKRYVEQAVETLGAR